MNESQLGHTNKRMMNIDLRDSNLAQTGLNCFFIENRSQYKKIDLISISNVIIYRNPYKKLKNSFIRKIIKNRKLGLAKSKKYGIL